MMDHHLSLYFAAVSICSNLAIVTDVMADFSASIRPLANYFHDLGTGEKGHDALLIAWRLVSSDFDTSVRPLIALSIAAY